MVGEMVKKGSFITRINWPGRSALIHVDDLSDLIIKLSKTKVPPGPPQKFLAYSENLTIYEISKIIHEKLKIKFKPIILPTFFWSILRKFRSLIPIFEGMVPYKIYNYFWRLGIISDDVVWCESKKVFTKFKNFKPLKFTTKVSDVL